MSHVQRLAVTVTTDASGDSTTYSEHVQHGLLSQIRYVKDATTPYTDGVDVDITVEATGEVLLDKDNVNASVTFAPRQATHDTLGAASLYAAGGEPVEDKIAIAQSRIKIVLAAGGATKTGVWHITLC